jgi:Holliday junction resolvase RusA-like endonuclease
VNAKDGIGKYNQRYTTPAYKAFVASMAWTIRAKCPKPFPGRIRVRLEFYIPARMDIDALVKPCYDAIQLAGLVRDDNLIEHGEQFRAGTARGESVICFVVEEVR